MKGIIGALISALFATACCAPALLFLLFGVSFGFLSFLDALSPFRIPLSFLSLAILAYSYKAYRTTTCACSLEKSKSMGWLYAVVLGVIVLLLVYPEMAALFFEE